MRYVVITIVLCIQISFGFTFLLNIGFLFIQSFAKMNKKSPKVSFLSNTFLFCFFKLKKKKDIFTQPSSLAYLLEYRVLYGSFFFSIIDTIHSLVSSFHC